MFTTEEIFDALFDRATGGEGKERLFGALAKKENRSELHKKLYGRHFSLLFLEFPLAGAAGFDLHVIHDGADIRRGVPFPDEVYGGHGRLFSWFGSEDRGEDGLDVVYDLRERLDAPPMVYLKRNDAKADEPDAFIADFFRALGDEGAAARYHEKRALLPDGWHTWYTGAHTGRKGKPLRIGSFLAEDLKNRCAKNIGLFEETLAAVGFPAPLSPAMREKLRELFNFPFPIDIQVDIMEDGRAGDTLGVSLTTGGVGRNALAASFESGAARDVMRLWEEWGVADKRWKRIPDATFQVSTTLRSRENARQRFVLSGGLGFLKVRFRGTGPFAYDAKGYITLKAIPQP